MIPIIGGTETIFDSGIVRAIAWFYGWCVYEGDMSAETHYLLLKEVESIHFTNRKPPLYPGALMTKREQQEYRAGVKREIRAKRAKRLTGLFGNCKYKKRSVVTA